jgi:hypothetical protein
MGKCQKCGGETKEGNALNNPPIEGSEGHGTLSQSNLHMFVDCMKCEACGHSYTDLPESSQVFSSDIVPSYWVSSVSSSVIDTERKVDFLGQL